MRAKGVARCGIKRCPRVPRVSAKLRNSNGVHTLGGAFLSHHDSHICAQQGPCARVGLSGCIANG